MQLFETFAPNLATTRRRHFEQSWKREKYNSGKIKRHYIELKTVLSPHANARAITVRFYMTAPTAKVRQLTTRVTLSKFKNSLNR